jgi:hypothetical protein
MHVNVCLSDLRRNFFHRHPSDGIGTSSDIGTSRSWGLAFSSFRLFAWWLMRLFLARKFLNFKIILNLVVKLIILSLSEPAQRSDDTSSDHKRAHDIPICGIPSTRPWPIRERSSRSPKGLLASLRHRYCHCFFACSPVRHGTAKATPIPESEPAVAAALCDTV